MCPECRKQGAGLFQVNLEMPQGPDQKDLVGCVDNLGPYPKSNQKTFKGLKRVKQYLMWFLKDPGSAKNGIE